MLAAYLSRFGAPDVLEIREVPTPTPALEQVLVRVRASALNRADLLQRRGSYPPPPGAPTDIPGIEFAGEVAGLGPGAREWKEGDRVFGLIGGGAHAEYVAVHERTVARVPAALDWATAGAVPEAYMTAHDALLQADARPGETVLVHAIGSGVGIASAQLARAFGLACLGTARTPGKIDRARAHGMTAGLAVGADLGPLTDFVHAHTGGHGADVVLDLAGGPYAAASLAAMAPGGRLVLIGLVAGNRAELDLGRILRARLTVRGTVMRARPLEERILVARRFAREVVPLLTAGALAPEIDARYPLARIVEAHERLESNATFGKVVLEI